MKKLMTLLMLTAFFSCQKPEEACKICKTKELRPYHEPVITTSIFCGDEISGIKEGYFVSVDSAGLTSMTMTACEDYKPN
jgi:hypothetical protein